MNDFGKRACQHGHDSEDFNASIYARMMGILTEIPSFLKNGILDSLTKEKFKKAWLEGDTYWQHIEFSFFYGVSPDREIWEMPPLERPIIWNNMWLPHLLFDQQKKIQPRLIGLLEIKSPWGAIYREPKEEHIAQCMMQMWIIRRTNPYLRYCDYFVGKLDSKTPQDVSLAKFLLVRFYYTKKYIRWMKKRLYHFSSCLWHTLWSKTKPRTRFEPDEKWIKSEPPPPVRFQVLYPQCLTCKEMRVRQYKGITLLLLARYKEDKSPFYHGILPLNIFKEIVILIKGILTCKRCSLDPFDYPAKVNGLSSSSKSKGWKGITQSKKIKTECD